MKQKLLMGAPVLLKIAAPKPEPPSELYLQFARDELDRAARIIAFNKITINNFNDCDVYTQEYLVDCYKLWHWYNHWANTEPPAKWQEMINLFEE